MRRTRAPEPCFAGGARVLRPLLTKRLPSRRGRRPVSRLIKTEPSMVNGSDVQKSKRLGARWCGLRFLCGMMGAITCCYACVFLPFSIFALFFFFASFVFLIGFLGLLPCLPFLACLAFDCYRYHLKNLALAKGETRPVGGFAWGFWLVFVVNICAFVFWFPFDKWAGILTGHVRGGPFSW